MQEKRKEIPIAIQMAALASYNGMADDPMQVVTSGVMIPEKDQTTLKYTESQEDETTGQVTDSEIQLIVGRNQVIMNRMGDYSSTMLFQRNKRFEASMRTPFGELPMAVYAREVRCDMGRDKGTVHLRYELSMQGAYASTNEVHLEYWAKDQESSGNHPERG